MTQSTNKNTETDPTIQKANIRPLVVIGLCCAAVMVGWSVDSLLAANDGALQVFIETFLPIFQWLLRLPEFFVV